MRRYLSIRTKLAALPALSLVPAAFLMLVVYPHQQAQQVRASTRAQVQTLTDMLAFAIATGLQTENYAVVNRAFETVKSDPRVEFMAAYDTTGTALAVYQPDGSTGGNMVLTAKEMEQRSLITSRVPLRAGGRSYGELVLGFSMRSLQEQMQQGRLFLGLWGGIIMAIGAIVNFWHGSKVSQHILGCRDLALAVANGDLKRRVSVRTHDELGVLADHLNLMVDRLVEMVREMQGATALLSESSSEILAATSQQSAGAAEQAAAINETTTTVDEVRQTSAQTKERAELVGELARQAVEASASGQLAVRKTLDVMNEIEARSEDISANIVHLSEQTQQIGEIINTVNEIAEQSHLLAVNASIEAARAGEQGKSFAVVAMEVRNLAEQSKQATAQVRRLLAEIQGATNKTVLAVEHGTRQVHEGVAVTQQTGSTIADLTKRIEDSAGAAEQILVSLSQQVIGMDQIAIAMRNINEATRQGLEGVRHSEGAARGLHRLGNQLQALASQYDLGQEPGARRGRDAGPGRDPHGHAELDRAA